MRHFHQSSGNLVADKRADFAHGYAEEVRFEAAIDLMRQAMELVPDWAAGWFRLGQYYEQSGDIPSALKSFQMTLRLSPEDYIGAGLKIAYLQNTAVAQAPVAYAQSLFDDYADRFDDSLVNRLGYIAPQLLSQMLSTFDSTKTFSTAMDLGCGTGLMAAQLRHRIEHFTGMDISAAMLAKAKDKQLYDELIHGSITENLAHAPTFDLIIAADVFIYIPQLGDVFRSIAHVLHKGGLFMFSIEKHDGSEPWLLRESMRHAHAASYVEGLLADYDFVTIEKREAVIRTDRAVPLAGLFYLVQKQGGANAA